MSKFFKNPPFFSTRQLILVGCLLCFWWGIHVSYRLYVKHELARPLEKEPPEITALKKQLRDLQTVKTPLKKHKNRSKNIACKKQPLKKPLQPKDINTATTDDFTRVKGIGKTLSERIVKYRKRLQGFSYPSQIDEVYGLEKAVISRIKKYFFIGQKPTIKKININTAPFKKLLAHPYIDYELCKKIFNYKRKNGDFKTLENLKNIDSFPIKKYDKIALYLSL